MAFQGSAFPINTYETDAGLSAYLGMPRDFADADRSRQFAPHTTEHLVKGVLVQNTGGVALSPGQALRWVAGGFGTKVQKAANGSPVVGFVPGNIQTAATIPDQAFFWMIVRGPTNVLCDTSAILEGSQLEASAATVGSVRLESTVPAANTRVTAATSFIATGGVAGLYRAYVNIPTV